MNGNSPEVGPRFLLFHLQAISARLLFVRHATGSVLAPRPLPFLSSPVEEDEPAEKLDLVQRLSLGVALAAELGFEPGMLVVEPGFRRRAEVPRALVDIHLARFTTLDAPHGEVHSKGGALHPITELRGGHPVEMAALRWAYDFLLAS